MSRAVSGVLRDAGRPTVLTLTSILPRFQGLGPTLASLLAQNMPVEIELWIPERYRRFPEWDGSLPEFPEGVRLRRCAEDWGPATKLIPALLDIRPRDADLIFLDDDTLYAPSLARALVEARARRPLDAIAASGNFFPPELDGRRVKTRSPHVRRRPSGEIDAELKADRFGKPIRLIEASGYCDMFAGWCGVLVRRSDFGLAAGEALPEGHPIAMGPGLAWPVDDVWISGLLEAGGTGIWVSAEAPGPTYRPLGATEALTLAVIEGRGRREANRAAVEDARARYGIWPAEALQERAGLARRLWRRLPEPLREKLRRALGR